MILPTLSQRNASATCSGKLTGSPTARFANARFPAQDYDLTPIVEHIGQEPVECFALATTSEKVRIWMMILAHWQGCSLG